MMQYNEPSKYPIVQAFRHSHLSCPVTESMMIGHSVLSRASKLDEQQFVPPGMDCCLVRNRNVEKVAPVKLSTRSIAPTDDRT